jgi:uncharacterized glyoxalase superfamily protein PhnB
MNIYLNFDGNCKDVFEFYRATSGGEFETLQTFADGPGMRIWKTPNADIASAAMSSASAA